MNWIETKAGLQMAQIVIKYLPKITTCLENMVRETGTVAMNSNHSRIVYAVEKLAGTKYDQNGDPEWMNTGPTKYAKITYTHIDGEELNDPDDGSWKGR